MSNFSYSSTSASSSSSFGPSTPSTQCDADYDTPSTFGLITPPGTLKDYYRSLKARHTLGMAAAMKSLPVDRTPRSRSMYDMDDNPFDRLYSLSPTGLPRSDTFGSLAAHLEDDTGRDRQLEQEAEAKMLSHAPASSSSSEAPWRPSLLQFARKESAASTPGSYSSEASFEGGSAADHLRVYGADTPRDEDDSPFSLSAYLQPSPALFQSANPYSPEVTVPAPASASALAKNNRISVASTMTTASFTSTASSSTIMSAASSGTVTIASAQVAKVKRPSMLRPRPRPHPYEYEYEHEYSGEKQDGSAYAPAIADSSAPGAPVRPARSRQASHHNTNQVLAADARGMSFSTEKQEMVEDGRSMSEVMVAMAGLRCQRGRNRYRPRQ